MSDDDPPEGDGPSRGDSETPPPVDGSAPVDTTSSGDAAGSPPDGMAVWNQVVDDLEATASEYREDGWDVLTVHPGDVTARPEGDRVGLDVLVPNDEFDRLQSLLADDVAIEGCRVFRGTHGGTVFAVVAMEDRATATAVIYPVYYDAADADAYDLLSRARAEGELRSYLRVLTGEYVEFTHEDPSLFVPDEEA